MVFLAKILTDQEVHFDGKTFSHFVQSGFTVEEAERRRALIADAVGRGEIDGVTVRVEIGESLPAAARRLRAFGADTGAQFLVSLKLHGPNVAIARTGDRETAARAAQALVLSRCGSGVRYVFDTFMDVDPGVLPTSCVHRPPVQPPAGGRGVHGARVTVPRARALHSDR